MWRFLCFVPATAALVTAALVWLETIGLPHLAWQYRYAVQARAGEVERHYLWCTYAGPYGAWRQEAVDGWCPWIAWRTYHGLR